jgi:hypothetical protein
MLSLLLGMFTSNFAPSLRITALEPLAKLADGQTYRIRVMQDTRSPEPRHAVAALRCENRDEIHWLTEGLPSPVEASRLMRNGFTLRQTSADLAFGVAQELIRNGSAVGIEA